MMNDFWTGLGDKPAKVAQPLTHPPHTCNLHPAPVIKLDKMETYAEILVTVGVTALSRPSLSCNHRPPSKLSTGTEASISIGTSFPTRDFTFSCCHLHITLNQNPQWATGRGKQQTREREGKPEACRHGSEEATL